jgi:ATP-binding cassette subfamily B protein
MQIIEISPFQAFRRSVAMVMQVVPKELRYVTILTLLGGAGPAIAIWLNKIIIDEGDEGDKENKQCPMPRAPDSLLFW